MKLKYYLRGVGIGIIFATLVMTVSSLVHKYNITDEYIIKEARKLGMVMKEELKDEESIWGKDETEEDSVVETENSEVDQNTEDTQVMGSESQPSESESQTPPESEAPQPSESESQTPPESEAPQPSESESQAPPESEAPQPSESESQTPPASEDKTYVTVTIVKGDYARQVAEKVKAAGLIQDAEDFRKYIGRRGYGQLFHAGTYKIPLGADYEEICQILISR